MKKSVLLRTVEGSRITVALVFDLQERGVLLIRILFIRQSSWPPKLIRMASIFWKGTNPVQENNRDSHFFSEYPAMYFWTLNLKILFVLFVLFVKGENKIIEPFNCPHMELRHVPA